MARRTFDLIDVAELLVHWHAGRSLEWHELVRGWFPELTDMRLRLVTWPEIARHHDYIAGQLKAGVRMSTVHQRLSDEQGLAASVASLRCYVSRRRLTTGSSAAGWTR
jgi:hypothetical protein